MEGLWQIGFNSANSRLRAGIVFHLLNIPAKPFQLVRHMDQL
jgi:hypothetical protein